MKECLILFVHCVFLLNSSFAQSKNTIKGKVSNTENGTVIPGCSVFINSTSKGTITNAKGEFELNNISPGKYELIVSSIGYEAYVFSFTDKNLPAVLDISLKTKAIELPDVTVEPFVEDGWEKWGFFFVSNFIGTSSNAFYCRIKNKKAIHFKYASKRNKLTAIADEPLIIENDALGYSIQFELEEFSYDENSGIIKCFGYSLFEEKSTANKKVSERWKNNRRNAYLGSIMHFMRSLYKNKLQDEGFEVRQIIRVPNAEKQRVKSIYNGNHDKADTFQPGKNGFVQNNKETNWPADSLHYYIGILQQPDAFESYTALLSAPGLVNTDKDQTKTFFFKDKLFVNYKNAKENKFYQSTINLITPAPMQIEANGNYYPPEELFAKGYWASSEKMVNLLPYDYIMSDDREAN